MESTYDDTSRTAWLSSGQVIHAFHKSGTCLGDACPVHKPSDHIIIGYPLHYDGLKGSFFREVNGKMVIDPDDYRLNNRGNVIIRNSVICRNCYDDIESQHRHDFVTCSCGQVSVDGGSDYLRRVGDGFIETSETVYLKDVQAVVYN